MSEARQTRMPLGDYLSKEAASHCLISLYRGMFLFFSLKLTYVYLMAAKGSRI
jgi:hypothetical protein